MGQTVGRSLGRCNGLDATQPLPERLVAFTRALKKLNAEAIDDLHRRLRAELANRSDDDIKEDGKKLRDTHPTEWLFNYGMVQVMQPGQRADWKHIDGGASFLHLGLGLFGNRVVKHWEVGSETPHEMDEDPGSVYVSTPAVYEHQVGHRDAAVEQECLMDFGDMGRCKVAIQLRCDLFSHFRGRKSTPKLAQELAASVVQP